MDYVIRKRKKGMVKPSEINCNRGLTTLQDEKKIELLSPSSAAFHKPDFNIHVLAIMGIKNPINVDDGNSCKGEELKWVRTEVDLDKHIIVPKINPNNTDSPDKFLENYLYNLNETTLDKSRPLWELHALHLELAEDVKGVVIFRIHHSLGDGTSLISLFQNAPNDNNNNNNIKQIFWRRISALWMIIQLFWNTFRDLLLFIATALFLKDKSPFEKSTRGSSGPRRIVYKILSLDDIKMVKNAMNCTINDVALGITQAGLSRYLSRRYGNDGNNHEDVSGKTKKFLKNILLRSVLLINIRPSGGIQALADMMEKDAEVKWGNSVGFVLLPFTIGLRNNPLDYVKEAKNVVDRKKNSLEAFFTFFMTDITMKLLGSKVANFVSKRINSNITICFSNVAGPLEEVSFYGHPITFLAPSAHGVPHPVLINFQSYSNKMMLVLAVDEHAVPDPHQMCDDIVDSLNLIKTAVKSQLN
ncbi:O-acyltransferase WSD1 [Bienertia sinuspersici]